MTICDKKVMVSRMESYVFDWLLRDYNKTHLSWQIFSHFIAYNFKPQRPMANIFGNLNKDPKSQENIDFYYI